MQDRRIRRADLQFDFTRIGDGLGKRNVLPVEARRAYIDGNQPVVMFGRGQDSGAGLESKGVPAGLGGERLHHTARAVAASLCLRAVAIDDRYVIVRAGRTRIVDRHDLIEGCFAIACQTDGCGGGDAIRAPAHIGNDDLVAEPVHPGEGCLCGHN